MYESIIVYGWLVANPEHVLLILGTWIISNAKTCTDRTQCTYASVWTNICERFAVYGLLQTIDTVWISLVKYVLTIYLARITTQKHVLTIHLVRISIDNK